MKHSFDFHFTYPVTYLPVRARTPKTIYLEGVEKIEIQGITRADTSIAIDLKVLNEFGNNERLSHNSGWTILKWRTAVQGFILKDSVARSPLNVLRRRSSPV